MHIEFSRVTWYSIALAIVLYVGTFVLAFYLGVEYKMVRVSNTLVYEVPVKETPTDVAPQGNNLRLPVGGEGVVDGLRISFHSLVQDSRCPTDVQCIQAGAVNTSVTFERGPHKETRTMPSDEVPLRFDEYSISIVRVEPARLSTKDIAPADYVVTFHVTRVVSM